MAETQETINQWQRDTFGDKASAATAVARMNVEVAELIYKINTGAPRKDVADEIADVYVVLCQIADIANIDIAGEVDYKMARNRAREWVLDGSGHGQHV